MSAAPLRPPAGGRLRRPTATARFGSSRRESHDASAFYERFHAPVLSGDTEVARLEPHALDVIHAGDARDMGAVASDSVALVVTSPPYFAGKEYEAALGEGGVPASYFDYLAMLRAVFAECARVLEPGGRIAVNVANLGRRPYRSLAGDVTEVLQDLGLLLRGEVVWWKGRAAGGSCAWGSFQHPANPVLRDVTERVVIAGKGRFDRALTPQQRRQRGLPSTPTISRDEFLEATTDLWEIPPESATRVGHPAPFPVELPARFIGLYTYAGDVVLDPFMGAGATAVAAVRSGRHYVGYDTDPAYVARARARVEQERGRLAGGALGSGDGDGDGEEPSAELARALAEGRQAREVAALVLGDCGFVEVRADVRRPGLGLEVSFAARDRTGAEWAFDLSGGLATSTPSGLRRGDALWRALGRAAVLHHDRPDVPVVLLTTEPPPATGPGRAALRSVQGPGRPVFDVATLLDPADRERLRRYAEQGPGAG